MTPDTWLADTRTSYDTVAASYADRMRDSLVDAPYATGALALFADLVRRAGGGPVADVGCGPGHVTAYLHGMGVDAYGIDLSPGMVQVARRDHPAVYRRPPARVSGWLRDVGFVVELEMLLDPDDPSPGAVLIARRR